MLNINTIISDFNTILGGKVMSLSEEWVNTELSNSEFEILHRAPDVEYSFYNSVKAGDMDGRCN